MSHPHPLYPPAAAGDEAAARALATLLSAHGPLGDPELKTLDGLDAYRRLRTSRERFEQLVQDCLQAGSGSSQGQSWLSATEQAQLDRALQAVPAREQRLLVCRLAAAAITADGHITDAERLAYDHARARWHISASEVTQAILRDPHRS